MSKANLVVLVWVFCLGSGPFPCLPRCCFFLAKRKSGRGICVSSVLVACFSGFVSRFAACIMEPRRFMMNFLIYLLAYPNVRTEPQSDIGRNRRKKNTSIEPFDQMASTTHSGRLNIVNAQLCIIAGFAEMPSDIKVTDALQICPKANSCLS